METAAGHEQLRFDSDRLPRAERFARYRELYARGAEATEIGPAFRATVSAWRLDRAVLYDRRLTDVAHQRPAERLARDGFEHWTLTLLVDGAFELGGGWGLQRMKPGEVALLDMGRPMQNRAVDAHIITVGLARERVQAAASDLHALHGLILPAEQAGLLSDYLRALARRLPMVPASAIPAVTQPIGLLLAAALAAGAGTASIPAQGDRVRQLIETQLGDPGFGPTAAVAQSGLSRATLYRLFHAQGGLALYIQRRRLNRVRAALANPGDGRGLAEIARAAGFASESQCSRLFREAYGVRPREFHAALARYAAVVGQMEQLQDEVR